MRKIFTIIAMMMLWTVSLFAQVPQKMAYQAVVRDADGKVITNQELGVQVSILQGSVDGASVYSESHTTTSTSAGAINIEIGGGKTSDDFSTIDWSKGPYFIQSTTEVNGKSVTVTSQLLSVPYALYAEKSKNVDEDVLRAMVLKVLADSGYVAGVKGDGDDSDIVLVDKKDGKLPGLFSVSADKQVKFSMGNLQYQASTKKWRFAENQYDVIGDDNKNISATYDGWIDLFGWGTSGYHNSSDTYNENYMPYSSSISDVNTTYNSYGYGPSTNQTDKNLVGTSAEYDWGVHNAISNGGNEAGQWRVLTNAEWTYLYSGRTNAAKLRTKATVEGVAGYVFFPDNWVQPDGISVSLDAPAFTTNNYSTIRWNVLEAQGAVFLPAAGYRDGTTVSLVGTCGYYWSSTYVNSGYAFCFFFNSTSVGRNYSGGRYNGRSVRLVQE